MRGEQGECAAAGTLPAATPCDSPSRGEARESIMNVRFGLFSASVIFGSAVLCGTPAAQAQCGCGYQIVNKVVYDQVPVTSYRLEYETIMEEQPVTTLRPEWTEEVRERRYTVARPVTETATREERFVVRRPVYETEYREEAYYRVSYVNET